MKNQIISAYRTAAQVGGKRYWTAKKRIEDLWESRKGITGKKQERIKERKYICFGAE